MFSTPTLIAAIAAVAVGVKAHGFVDHFEIDGTSYGTTVFVSDSDARRTPMRPMDYGNPIRDVYGPDITCGINARPGPKIVDVGPGSYVSFHWVTDSTKTWVHDKGPAMAYLAKCTNGDCSTFDASQGDWFKVAMDGQRADGTYVLKDLFDDKEWGFNMPEHLEDGDYLIRHEIIALHFSNFRVNTNGGNSGAEFYPMCVAVRFKGNGGKNPSKTVKFPGAYDQSDTGFYNPDFYTDGYKYPLPAPPVRLPTAGDGSNDNDNNDSGNSGNNDNSGNGTSGNNNDNNNTDPAPVQNDPAPVQDQPDPTVDDPKPPKPTKQCKRSNRKKRSTKLVRSADVPGSIRRSRHHLAMEQVGRRTQL